METNVSIVAEHYDQDKPFAPIAAHSRPSLNHNQLFSIDSQANIPTTPGTPILPPLKVSNITREELLAIEQTTKNVCAPYMRKLIHFDVPDFAVSFKGSFKTGWLKQDLEVTDFTYQTSLPTLLTEDISFVFRFNSQTGEGYRLGRYNGPRILDREIR